jgi:hypothetical protein
LFIGATASIFPVFNHIALSPTPAEKILAQFMGKEFIVLFQWRTESTIKRNTGSCANTGLCALVCRQPTTGPTPLRAK